MKAYPRYEHKPSEHVSQEARNRVGEFHARRHPEFVEGCFLCKIKTVNLSPSATPTRQSHHAKWALRKDKEWSRDMAAYKRLRENGLQPRQIDGSAELESRSDVPEHVATGHPEWPVEKIREAEDTMGMKLHEGNTAPWSGA